MLKIELNERNYISFIEYAIKTCNSISLVFEKSEAEANDLKDLLKEADKGLYEEKKIKHAQRDAKKNS